MNKRIISSFVTALATVLAINTFSLSAASISKLKDQKEGILSETKKAKDMLNETQTEKNSVLSEIVSLDIELDEVSEEYYITSDELDKTSALLSQTEADLVETEKERENQYKTLKQRIRFMQENSSLSYIEILFKAKSFSDFLNSVEYINSIVEYDNELVKNLEKTEATIAAQVNEITSKKMEVALLASQLETKKHALEDKVESKVTLIAKLEDTEQDWLSQLKMLEDSNAQLEKEIKAAEAEAAKKAAAAAAAAAAARRSSSSSASNTTVKYNGKMGWPVQGYAQVTSEYGMRYHPVYKVNKMHTGVDLRAPSGTNILAAEKGTVITAKYMSGYGYTVVIDHGGGVSTLYAHNSKLLVSVGDEVSRGQVISKAGSTGVSTGSHLHFEVRINGSYVNPTPYIGNGN